MMNDKTRKKAKKLIKRFLREATDKEIMKTLEFIVIDIHKDEKQHKKKVKYLTYDEATIIHNKSYDSCINCPLFDTEKCVFSKEMKMEREININEYSKN